MGTVCRYVRAIQELAAYLLLVVFGSFISPTTALLFELSVTGARSRMIEHKDGVVCGVCAWLFVLGFINLNRPRRARSPHWVSDFSGRVVRARVRLQAAAA